MIHILAESETSRCEGGAGTVQITIDSKEPLENVLRVVGATYGVTVGVVEGGAPAAGTGRRGRPRGVGRATKRQPGRPRGRKRAQSGLSMSDVREWARGQGHQVSTRGPVPTPIVEAYRAAH